MNCVALIVVEGTLAQQADLRSSPPTKWARPLYDGIRSQFRTVILSSCPESLTRSWLQRENIGGVTAVLSWQQVGEYGAWKVDQVRDFLANAWDIAFFMDQDPRVTAKVQDMGVLTLTMGQPTHFPGWQEAADDGLRRGFQPWSQRVDTVESSP